MNDNPDDHTPFQVADFFNLHSYYWQTRRWHYLRQGVPAIVVSLLVLVPVVLSPLMRASSGERYRAAFNSAVKQEQYETANLFLSKLDSLPLEGNEADQARFNRALVDLGCGRTAKGMATMSELAPDDSYGYGPAHLWLANKYLAEDPTISGDDSGVVVHHLESALRSTADENPIRMALGHYYYRNNDPENAAKHLTTVAKDDPNLHFAIANLHETSGNQQLSEKHFRLAAETLNARLLEHPNEIETRTNLAISLHKIGEFQQSIQTLVDGIDPSAPDSVLRKLLSTFYLAEADRLRLSSEPDDPEFAQSLEMLSNALRVAPENDAAVNRIAEIASHEGPTAEKAAQVVRQLLAEGKMTATAHLILGTAALQKGSTDRAKRHYSQAYSLDPQMPALLNNVAWILSHEEPPKSLKALEIINFALEKADPKDPLLPFMLDTRGQIHVQLQHWNEALIDLERALAAMPRNPNVHKALATAYRAVGDQELAREHDLLAEQLRVNR